MKRKIPFALVLISAVLLLIGCGKSYTYPTLMDYIENNKIEELKTTLGNEYQEITLEELEIGCYYWEKGIEMDELKIDVCEIDFSLEGEYQGYNFGIYNCYDGVKDAIGNDLSKAFGNAAVQKEDDFRYYDFKDSSRTIRFRISESTINPDNSDVAIMVFYNK